MCVPGLSTSRGNGSALATPHPEKDDGVAGADCVRTGNTISIKNLGWGGVGRREVESPDVCS